MKVRDGHKEAQEDTIEKGNCRRERIEHKDFDHGLHGWKQILLEGTEERLTAKYAKYAKIWQENGDRDGPPKGGKAERRYLGCYLLC